MPLVTTRNFPNLRYVAPVLHILYKSVPLAKYVVMIFVVLYLQSAVAGTSKS